MTKQQQLARGLDSEVIAMLKAELARNWHVNESTDRTDGSRVVAFDIDPRPDNPSKIMIDEVQNAPTMFVHCGKNLQVLVKTGALDNPKVRIGFDDGPLMSERWNPGGEMVLSDTSKALVGKMLGAKTVRFEYKPKGKPVTSVTYNMADLSDVFKSEPVCSSKLK